VYKKTALELNSLFLKKEVSAVEVTRYFLNRIERFEPQIGSLLEKFETKALKKAEELDKKLSEKKEIGKLGAVPIILKDNMHMKGEKTTCASAFLKNYVAPFNATVTTLIEKADGIILGKSNMDEFAMGSSTENSSFQKSYNPWNLECSPGGSSGGSAAAVSAMLAPLSLGSDTGGSIRQPAALCNLYGFKPTYGRVSRFGLVAFGSSLDQIGPFARSIEDVALMQEVISHYCPYDSTSIPNSSESYLESLSTSIKGKTIGVPFSLLNNIDPEIVSSFQSALDIYKSLGVNMVDVNLDLINYSIPVYYILATAEASTNLARFDGIRYGTRSKEAKTLEEIYELSRGDGFGPEVKQRILLGTYVLSAGYQDAYYKKAQKVRTLIISDYKKAFQHCDIIALPTTPTTAFKLGSIQDPITMYKQDIFTISANLAGIPALSMPIAPSNDGLPIGMQLQGPLLKDARVLRFASHFSKATNFHKNLPPLFDKEVF
jgi:aspartyl-tRNA(Asn)/glutamyl-tRNA(Gln) amidotransferase subunit A